MKMVKILGGRDGVHQVILKVEAFFPGRETDRRVLTADVDAEVGLTTCAWSHPRAESRIGFGLIAVSVAGEGVQVGGGVEQKEGLEYQLLRMRAESCQQCLSHTHVCACEVSQVQKTTKTHKTQKNVCAVRCSVYSLSIRSAS